MANLDSLSPAAAAVPDRAALAAEYAPLYDLLRQGAAVADQDGALPPEVLAALRTSGILAAAVPAEYGGRGGTAALTNRLVEQVAAVDPSVAIILFQHYAVTARIVEWGTPAQRDRYLPLLAGPWLAASAWSESGAGADKRHLSTAAVPTAAGWRLTGAKTFTTGAGLADVYLVLAQTGQPSATSSGYGSRGQTFFLVESGRPGMVAHTGMDLTGMRASATGFLELRDCEVGDGAVLGPLGRAPEVIAGVRHSGATLGAVGVGIAQTAYELALTHAQRRGLTDQQAVRHRLVDLAAQLETARAVVDSAGRRDTGHPDLTTLYSKLSASQLAEQVCQEALRLLGSAGFLRGHPLAKLSRDVRAVALMGPTNDLCRELAAATFLTTDSAEQRRGADV